MSSTKNSTTMSNTTEQKNNRKPKNISEAAEYFSLLPRAIERLHQATTDEILNEYEWSTLRALAFACKDPRTSAKGITLSQKVMMYRKYDKLWDSISEATRLYGAKINSIKIQPEIGEGVADFRARYLKEILGL